MPQDRKSLLAGRNQDPLSPEDIRRAANTFLGMENAVNARYDATSSTIFRVARDLSNQIYGEIVFGPDIYPGRSVIDPNSALGLQAAAAHELCHYHRWKDKTVLPQDSLDHVDEALTSLEATIRYSRNLSEHDIRQLISDVIQRLQLYVQDQEIADASGGLSQSP